IIRETSTPTRPPTRSTDYTLVREEPDYLYWYSVQGESGQSVNHSEHWLDKHHVAFWKECIDDTYPGEDLTPRVHMVPQRVEAAMVPLVCE
ncbi:DUF6176 family protein, partial [Dermabacter hominis]|uniref:DUF6176 family protein n=1 Tax=Dermabacter hominis TaxID=36740 RepID=UPI00316AE97D|nr:DUF6176 family protein [Dermabacter hominis]